MKVRASGDGSSDPTWPTFFSRCFPWFTPGPANGVLKMMSCYVLLCPVYISGNFWGYRLKTCPLSTPDSKSPADSCGVGLPRIILKPSNSTTHFMNLDLTLRPAHDMVPFCTVSSLSLAAVRFSRKLSCRNTWQRW